METAAACIATALPNNTMREMMPMAKSFLIRVFPALSKAASFAAYSIALYTTGDASAAAALHNSEIEG